MNELNIFDQLKIITIWDIIVTVGNMITIIASMLYLCDIFLEDH